jgi:hypothetical protein
MLVFPRPTILLASAPRSMNPRTLGTARLAPNSVEPLRTWRYISSWPQHCQTTSFVVNRIYLAATADHRTVGMHELFVLTRRGYPGHPRGSSGWCGGMFPALLPHHAGSETMSFRCASSIIPTLSAMLLEPWQGGRFGVNIGGSLITADVVWLNSGVHTPALPTYPRVSTRTALSGCPREYIRFWWI